MDPLALKRARIQKRGANFTMEESNLLVDLIVSHAAELDSGRDAASWKTKNAVWTAIADTYNAQCVQQRSVSVLRKKFENMKKDLKKKMAAHATELVMKENGQVEAETLSLLPHEKKLARLLKVSRDLLCSWLAQDQTTKSVFDKDDSCIEDYSPPLSDGGETKYPPPRRDSPSESLLMAVLDSLSDAEESEVEVREERVTEKIPSSRSGKRQRDPQMTNLRLEARVLRQKAELLKLQIDHQKTEMQRSSQIHTYTLKTMESELRLKNLQERLLLKQLGEHKCNGT